MTIRDQDVLKNQYENLKLICYQLPHFLSDFENEFSKKSELERKVCDALKESMKTCLADAYITSELIFNLINAEDNSEILRLIEAEKSEA